jgi:hypothetical protein
VQYERPEAAGVQGVLRDQVRQQQHVLTRD